MAEPRGDLARPPPPRWRVVERDRKLVVIDTKTGEAASPESAAPTPSPGSSQIQFDGSAELTTLRLYDDKGPRTIRLDPDRAATVARLKLFALGLPVVVILIILLNPWLLLPLLALTDRRVRARIRQATTDWLDRAEAG